jgi:predicted TIM-barrel enzyme
MGCGFSRELEMIEMAHKKEMFTLAWCFDEEQAKKMIRSGADMIGAMVMFGPDGDMHSLTLDYALERAKEIRDAAKAERDDIFVITHGPAFNDGESAEKSVQYTHSDGYASGSSGEVIPAIKAVSTAVKAYRNISLA